MGDSENKVIRKKDPSIRKNIYSATLKKIEDFLKEQKEPIFKSEIVKQTGVNYDSLNVALKMIPIKFEEDGRIKLKRGKNV